MAVVTAAAAPSVEAIAVRAERVRDRIARAGGRDVQLVAVTKGFGPETAAAAVAAGLDDLGENYAQELAAKAGAAPRARWHFIGRLQRNKVNLVAPLVTTWHSVDRIALGRTIADRQPGGRVLVQVNTSGEVAKGGCDPAEAPGLVDALRRLDLDVVGLMTVGPLAEPEAARPGFRLLATMAGDLGLHELSMGMSGDLEVAVEEGATIVRVGTDLFGPRPTRAAVPAGDGPMHATGSRPRDTESTTGSD